MVLQLIGFLMELLVLFLTKDNVLLHMLFQLLVLLKEYQSFFIKNK